MSNLSPTSDPTNLVQQPSDPAKQSSPEPDLTQEIVPSSKRKFKPLIIVVLVIGMLLLVGGIVWMKFFQNTTFIIGLNKPNKPMSKGESLLVQRIQGTELAQTTKTEIVVVGVDGTETILRSWPQYVMLQGTTSPDKERIFLIEQSDPLGASTLVVYASDGAEVTRTTLSDQGASFQMLTAPCHWSPDNKKIACAASTAYNETNPLQPTNVLFVLDIVSGEVQKVTGIPQDGLGPLLVGAAGWLDDTRYMIVKSGNEMEEPQPDLDMPPAQFFIVDTTTQVVTPIFKYQYDANSNFIVTIPYANVVVFNAFSRVNDDRLVVMPLDTLQPQIIESNELTIGIGRIFNPPSTKQVVFSYINDEGYWYKTYDLETGESMQGTAPDKLWNLYGLMNNNAVEVWGTNNGNQELVMYNKDTNVQRKVAGEYIGILNIPQN